MAADGYRPLAGSARNRLAGAERIGPASPDDELSVTIVVRRRPDGLPLPGNDDWAGLDWGRRVRRSGQEFADRYGALPRDLAAVEEFARSHGLEVTASHAARRSVRVVGTVRQMNGAFGVNLGRYEAPGAAYRGREGLVHVPKSLRGVITGVFGLDNRPVGKPNGPPGHFGVFTPPMVAGLYDFPRSSAARQTIGILSLGGGYRLGDVTDFYASLGSGFTAPRITDVPPEANKPGPFGQLPPSNGDAENLGDICVASSVAQGAEIAVYFAPDTQQGWVDALARAIHPDSGDPAPSVLSISWFIADGDDAAGLALRGVSGGWVDAVNACFHDAAIVGVTVLVGSGDNGASSRVPDGKAHVEYPASDPWVTSVGGTTISNVSGSQFDENTWNESTPGTPNATGGGISDRFDVPAWQQAANLPASVNDPAHRGRGVPDVAGNAAAASGYHMTFAGLSPTLPFFGTSAGTPLYAGLIAVINASLLAPVGYLNPTFYQLTRVFRDINDGRDNAASFAPQGGSPVTSAAYRSGPGWDACTGLGVVDGNKLLAAIHALLGRVVMADSSSEGPALASHDGRLFIAWKGSGNAQLNILASDDDGKTIAARQTLNQTTEHSPALVSHNGQLFLAWAGQGRGQLNLETMTLPVFTEDPLDRANALMAFATALLGQTDGGNRPGPEALHDLTTAADALRGFDPPDQVRAQYLQLLLKVLRALATALFAAGDAADAVAVALEAIDVAHRAAAAPAGNPLLVMPDATWLAGLLGPLGQPGEAVTAQQGLVDMLAGYTPAAADLPDYEISLAEARHNLLVRLIGNGQAADAAPQAAGTLAAYQQYAALPDADVLRVAQDLSELDKQLDGAALISQALDTARVAVSLLQGFTPPSGRELEYQIAFAEARHDLIARLFDSGPPGEALPLIEPVIAAYRDYVAAAGADLARVRTDLTQLVGQLLAAGFTAQGEEAQLVLNQMPAS
jgi:kumamolisin